MRFAHGRPLLSAPSGEEMLHSSYYFAYVEHVTDSTGFHIHVHWQPQLSPYARHVSLILVSSSLMGVLACSKRQQPFPLPVCPEGSQMPDLFFGRAQSGDIAHSAGIVTTSVLKGPCHLVMPWKLGQCSLLMLNQLNSRPVVNMYLDRTRHMHIYHSMVIHVAGYKPKAHCCQMYIVCCTKKVCYECGMLVGLLLHIVEGC